jgi:predicted signal transduction protein with EAL and GGDEF domain
MYVKKLFQFDVYLPIPHSSYQDPGVHKHDSGFGDSRRHNTCLDRRFPFRLHDRRQRLTNFMSKQTNFSLKLYFSIVSLVAILASALSLSIYYRHATIDQLIEIEERNYVSLSRTIANTLFPKYGDFLRLAETMPQSQLVENSLSQQLHDDGEGIVKGLPNRSLFVDRLEQAMKIADRNEQLTTVLFVDLDQFKNINDSLGHDAGDSLLKGAAERLSSCMRASDTVARWGGDEFCLLLQQEQADNKPTRFDSAI